MISYVDDWYLYEEWDSLTEAKADQHLLINHVGQLLADRLTTEQSDFEKQLMFPVNRYKKFQKKL